MIKGNDKFSGRNLNTPEQRCKMNSKVVIKEKEFTRKEIIEMYPLNSEEINQKLWEEGFNMDKLITREENIEKNSVIYKQRKYIIPKRKKYEET